MRGIVFLGNRQLEIREFADPDPGPGQAVVAMRASGLCGSDLTPYRGAVAQTAISGHEPCGQVAAVGPTAAVGEHMGHDTRKNQPSAGQGRNRMVGDKMLLGLARIGEGMQDVHDPHGQKSHPKQHASVTFLPRTQG